MVEGEVERERADLVSDGERFDRNIAITPVNYSQRRNERRLRLDRHHAGAQPAE